MGSRVTIKGQVTIPQSVRRAAGIHPGDEVDFRIDPDGRVVLSRSGHQHALAREIERLRRDPPIRDVSTDEIMRLTRGDG